jgi:hypothetical protein
VKRQEQRAMPKDGEAACMPLSPKSEAEDEVRAEFPRSMGPGRPAPAAAVLHNDAGPV